MNSTTSLVPKNANCKYLKSKVLWTGNSTIELYRATSPDVSVGLTYLNIEAFLSSGLTSTRCVFFSAILSAAMAHATQTEFYHKLSANNAIYINCCIANLL